MLALVNTPDGEEPVELREVDEPAPASDETLVDVRAFSLNRGELTLLAGRPEGWQPGQDIAGVVLQEAADGNGPPEGARVVGLVDGAGWAERAAVPTTRLAVLPDEVGLVEAASLPIAGLTALRTLRHGGALLGRRVLITGAAGGVGRLAVQLAARSGAHVTGVAGSPERGEGLEKLGADEVVTDVEDAEGPFDLILESVGGASLVSAVGLIAPDGTIILFGNSSGEPAPISFPDFFGHENARLQTFFSFASGPPESYARDLGLLAALVASGAVVPQIGFEESWRELSRATEALRERRVAGKAILRVD